MKLITSNKSSTVVQSRQFQKTVLLCDFAAICINPLPVFCEPRKGLHRDTLRFKDFSQLLIDLSVPASAEFFWPTPDSDPELVSSLRHRYESIADESEDSETGSVSMKIFDGDSTCDARLQLSASPAQVALLNNSYGSTDIGGGAVFVLELVRKLRPQLEKRFDFSTAHLTRIDCTLSYILESPTLVDIVFEKFRGVSAGQVRYSSSELNTHYYNKSSNKSRLAIYRKGPLHEKKLKQLQSLLQKKMVIDSKSADSAGRIEPDLYLQRQLSVFQNDAARELSSRSLRFEARKKTAWFVEQRFEIGEKTSVPASFLSDSPQAAGTVCPLLLTEFIEFERKFNAHNSESNLCYEIWRRSFGGLIDAFEGRNMSIFNPSDVDYVRERIRDVHQKITKKGNVSFTKANNVFNFYSALLLNGYESHVKSQRAISSSGDALPSSFYSMIDALLECGFTRAQLQEFKPALDRKNHNVIHMNQLIHMSFCNPKDSTPAGFEPLIFKDTDRFLNEMKNRKTVVASLPPLPSVAAVAVRDISRFDSVEKVALAPFASMSAVDADFAESPFFISAADSDFNSTFRSYRNDEISPLPTPDDEILEYFENLRIEQIEREDGCAESVDFRSLRSPAFKVAI